MAGNPIGKIELGAIGGSTRLVDTIAERIKAAILEGRLTPGTQLSVPALARNLDVSRSPVREAVLQLVGRGLAVEQPRKGVVVATVDQEALQRIHEIREFLEAAAARYCAERASKATASDLKSILAEQKRAVAAADASGYYRTNAVFHRLIVEGAQNLRLTEILGHLEGQMALALRHLATSHTHMTAGHKEHLEIAAQIIAGRGPDAEHAMRAHIAATLVRMKHQFGSK